MPNHPAPVPDFLLALGEDDPSPPTPSSFPFAPPTSSPSEVLFQRTALTGSLAPARLLFASLRSGRGQERRNSNGAGAGVLSRCDPTWGWDSSVGRAPGAGPEPRARPGAPRAWASRPRVPRCLTGILANQGVRPGCHVTREAALFPARPEGGVELLCRA